MLSRPIEPGLIRIFRFFVWAEAFAFSLVPLTDNFFIVEINNFYQDPFFIIFLQSLILAVYLSIPWLQRKLRQYYLLIALIVAVLVPSVTAYRQITQTMQLGLPIDMVRIWALLPLLMIPLVPTAWQYNFRVVFIFFVGLGMFDGIHLIMLNEGINESILMPLYAIFIRVTSLALVGLMITELMQTQREQRRKLMHANLQLSQQSIVQEQLAISRERNRLARDLHDTLAHTLSGLTVQLEAMHTLHPEEQDQIGSLISTALNTCRHGMLETRRALKALRAESLEEMGLLISLKNLGNQFQQRTGLTVLTNFPHQIDMFSNEEEQAIFRIAQEALENIDRHAEATTIWFSLHKTGEKWVFTIRDDGRGFNQQSKGFTEDQLGIQGMRERAASVGAMLRIESSTNIGTTLSLTMKNT